MAQSSLKIPLLLVTLVTQVTIGLANPIPSPWIHPSATDTISWQAVVETYSSLLGEPYRGGGISPGGFDCSGLLFFTFGQHHVRLPASSSRYASEGHFIERDSIQLGDFLLFSGRSAKEIGHVGLCVGLEEGKILMLHSATHGGVVIENWVGQAYYEHRYIGARRLLYFVP